MKMSRDLKSAFSLWTSIGGDEIVLLTPSSLRDERPVLVPELEEGEGDMRGLPARKLSFIKSMDSSPIIKCLESLNLIVGSK